MRVVHTKRALPTCFRTNRHAKGLVFEADICPRPRGRLKAKLLVFETPRALQRFWKATGQGKLGRYDVACVQQLHYSRTLVRDDREVTTLICDPRYFCLIGLSKTHLGTMPIAHESVHVGFAYAKRREGRPWSKHDEFGEENVAYPAGHIASKIVRVLVKAKLIE